MSKDKKISEEFDKNKYISLTLFTVIQNNPEYFTFYFKNLFNGVNKLEYIGLRIQKSEDTLTFLNNLCFNDNPTKEKNFLLNELKDKNISNLYKETLKNPSVQNITYFKELNKKIILDILNKFNIVYKEQEDISISDSDSISLDIIEACITGVPNDESLYSENKPSFEINYLDKVINFQKEKEQYYLDKTTKLEKYFQITMVWNAMGAIWALIMPKLANILFISLAWSTIIWFIQKKVNDEKILFHSIIQSFVELKNFINSNSNLSELKDEILSIFVNYFIKEDLKNITYNEIDTFWEKIESKLIELHNPELILKFYEILNPIRASVFNKSKK